MSPEDIQLRWRPWAQKLTNPSPQINDNEQRQKAQILASLSFALLLLAMILMPIWVMIAPAHLAARYISIGIILALGSIYGLSRTRFYGMGASLLTFSVLGLLFAIFMTGPGRLTERMLVLKFLIFVVLIASLFSRKLTLFVFIIGLSVIGAFFFVPGVPLSFAYSYLVFFLVVSVLGIIYGELNGRQKQRLLASEEKYRSLVAAMSEGIVLQTQSGAIEACNSAAEQILGLTAEQMMGRESVDLRWHAIHEDGSPFPGDEHPAMVTLRTGQPLKDVIMGVHQPDGELRWLSVNSQPLLEPDAVQPYAVVTSFADITESKRNERAIKEAQHRYHALFEQAHDAIFMINLQGLHMEANHRAAELLGYSTAEIQNLHYLALSAEASKSEVAFQKLLAGELLPVYERLFRRKDGSLIPVEINVELVRDIDGNPLHIQSAVRDISERKRTQQRELALALEKERTQMLTTFIQNASHEFRTPLSIIETAAFVMARLPDANERLQRVTVIHEQIKRLVKLINTLLIITKLENESARHWLPVDVGDVLASVHQRMKAQYPASLTFHSAGLTDLPTVLGDSDELKEAFWQIVDNACRFSGDDGVITAVSGTTDQHLWLDIHDAGPGILADSLPHIFEIFWREDEAHSTPGFGLGLAIANRIIQAHNGKIQIASEPQVGTTVRILLPIACNAETSLN
ncbi:MAG: PAS domain S-box protein [Anaerolineales bacterium]|nr:PAS domain S-box protein [Anaerolineales bacterium]